MASPLCLVIGADGAQHPVDHHRPYQHRNPVSGIFTSVAQLIVVASILFALPCPPIPRLVRQYLAPAPAAQLETVVLIERVGSTHRQTEGAPAPSRIHPCPTSSQC